MDEAKGPNRKFLEARVSGPRGHIAMTDNDFTALNEHIPANAHHRLMSAFAMFCAGQRRALPASVYRTWTDTKKALFAEFTAYGVTVSGRLVKGATLRFDIASITSAVDIDDSGRRDPGKPSQAELPLYTNPAKRTME